METKKKYLIIGIVFMLMVTIGSNYAGQLYSDDVNSTGGVVRPVISLKSCVELKGSGVAGDPYTVLDMNDGDACALAEN